MFKLYLNRRREEADKEVDIFNEREIWRRLTP